MKLTDYIKGDKRGKQANAFEREALEDQFLSDAIDGYESVYDNHFDRLTDLQQKIESKARGRNKGGMNKILLWGASGLIAAGAITAVSVLYLRPPANVYEQTDAVLAMSGDEADALATNETYEGEQMTLYYDGSKHDITIPENASSDDEGAVVIGETFPSVQEVSSLRQAAQETSERSYEERISLKSAEEKPRQEQTVAEFAGDTAAAEVNDETSAVSEQTAAPVSAQRISMDNELKHKESTFSQSSVIDEDGTIYIQNNEFERYFKRVRTVNTDSSGELLNGKVVVVEFRVNSRGVPSGIKILSSPSRELNAELIEALTSGPVWEQSNGRVRTKIRL